MDDLRLPIGKRCSKCVVWKFYEDYYRRTCSSIWRAPACIECERLLKQRIRQRKRAEAPSRATLHTCTTEWLCKGCNIVRPIDCFSWRNKKRGKRNYLCKICTAAYRKVYRVKNCEELKVKAAETYVNNREVMLKRQTQYRERNLETDRVRSKQYREANKVEVNARRREARHNNPEWAQLHRHNARLRRARKKGAEGNFTFAEWNALCELYDWRCLCCGCEGELEADHVVPLSRGGANVIGNIQPLCKTCNCRKHVKTIDYR